jgi:hypothetical protein
MYSFTSTFIGVADMRGAASPDADADFDDDADADKEAEADVDFDDAASAALVDTLADFFAFFFALFASFASSLRRCFTFSLSSSDDDDDDFDDVVVDDDGSDDGESFSRFRLTPVFFIFLSFLRCSGDS